VVRPKRDANDDRRARADTAVDDALTPVMPTLQLREASTARATRKTVFLREPGVSRVLPEGATRVRGNAPRRCSTCEQIPTR
jgi:hypothetical protein